MKLFQKLKNSPIPVPTEKSILDHKESLFTLSTATISNKDLSNILNAIKQNPIINTLNFNTDLNEENLTIIQNYLKEDSNISKITFKKNIKPEYIELNFTALYKNSLFYLTLKKINNEDFINLLKTIKENKTITELDFTKTDLTEENLTALKNSLKDNTNIAKINFKKNINPEYITRNFATLYKSFLFVLTIKKINNEDFISLLKAIKENKVITELDFTNTDLSEENLTTLKNSLNDNTNIAKINFKKNISLEYIDEIKKVTVLNWLASCTKTGRLTLSQKYLDYTNFDGILEIIKNKKINLDINEIDLQEIKLDNEIIQKIITFLKNEEVKIKKINLDETKISTSYLNLIEELTVINRIYRCFTTATRSSILELEKIFLSNRYIFHVETGLKECIQSNIFIQELKIASVHLFFDKKETSLPTSEKNEISINLYKILQTGLFSTLNLNKQNLTTSDLENLFFHLKGCFLYKMTREQFNSKSEQHYENSYVLVDNTDLYYKKEKIKIDNLTTFKEVLNTIKFENNFSYLTPKKIKELLTIHEDFHPHLNNNSLKIQNLDISNNNLSDKLHMESIEHFLKTIKILNISENKCGENWCKLLSSVISKNKLEQLYFNKNILSDNDILNLALSLQNSTLIELHLNETRISDLGLQNLNWALSSKSPLKVLAITDNCITNDSMEILKEMLNPKKSNLEKIRISKNKISIKNKEDFLQACHSIIKPDCFSIEVKPAPNFHIMSTKQYNEREQKLHQHSYIFVDDTTLYHNQEPININNLNEFKIAISTKLGPNDNSTYIAPTQINELADPKMKMLLDTKKEMPIKTQSLTNNIENIAQSSEQKDKTKFDTPTEKLSSHQTNIGKDSVIKNDLFSNLLKEKSQLKLVILPQSKKRGSFFIPQAINPIGPEKRSSYGADQEKKRNSCSQEILEFFNLSNKEESGRNFGCK